MCSRRRSVQPQYLLSTSGHIHPPHSPSTNTHNALICLHERLFYRNIAFQNTNTCIPRPQGEKWLIQLVWRDLTTLHEKCRSYVRQWSSLTGKTLFVELLTWIIYDQKVARDGRKADRGMVETRNVRGNMRREKAYWWRGKYRKESIYICMSTSKQKTARRLTEEKGLRINVG
jgi:hypothetical protein